MLFHGRDEAGAEVVVALDRSAWDSVRQEWSFDPLTGVERLARMGHWAMLGDQLVWRVDFI